MRILVVSDSHGNKWNFQEALEKESSSEVVYFLGDGYRDYEEMLYSFGEKKAFIAVSGNCDLACTFPDKDIRTIGGVRIYATHGYMEKVKFGFYTLECSARQENCRIALFGHTHEPYSNYYDGLYLFNPGSINNGFYGVIDIAENGIICFNKNLYSY